MQLPQKIIPYMSGLLWVDNRFTTTFLSKLTFKSHDYLTRIIKLKCRWKLQLLTFTKQLDLSDGYLIIDETECDKSYAKKIPGLCWIYSHLKNDFVFGFQLVVLCWTNNDRTIPLGWKIYRKGGKTKIVLARELLLYGLKLCKPKAVLFDSFYSSNSLLCYLNDEGITFYSQVAKNRNIDGKQLQKYHNGSYWDYTGKLSCGLLVKVTRNRKKYFITNAVNLGRKEIEQTYSIRWRIEEVFRFVKDQLGFQKCEMRSQRSQNNHFGVCFVLYCLLQDSAEETQMTMYAVKEQLILARSFRGFGTLANALHYDA